MNPNTDDGALYVPLTGDSKQFIGALDEAERRVKGFSSSTVAEGEKIDKAFRDLVQRVKESKDAIAATEVDLKKMEGLLKNISPGAAKADLIGEVNAAKRALQEEKMVLAGLEQQVKATGGAHNTFLTQLRQMKEELVGMEAAGKRGTAEYSALQNKFADLTNAMRDAQKQANILANDERGMQGVIMGLTGITGAAAAAQGAIGLFSGENENLQKVMLKVQSLMAITIGMQQVQQALNKDSAFMLVTVAKAKNILAAAELRLATAFGISTAAARVLMATLTLGLSAAIVVAIAAITRLVNKSQEAKKATQEFNKATAEEAYKTLTSFEKMRLEWNRLGDDMKAKNKFIKDNKDAFEELGIQVRGTADAENIFVKNTEAFRTALMERAKALASAELAQETYKKFLEKDLEAKSMKATSTTTTPVSTTGDIYTGGEVRRGQTVVSTEYSDKWLKNQNEANDLLGKFNTLMTGSIEHEKNYRNALKGLGIDTTENLEKIALLEQKISEQERLMLEAAEAGNKPEVKLIQEKIEQLKEELRLRNMLVNAIYAQGRANDMITQMHMVSGAFEPKVPARGSIGAPSTGGKEQGDRYWQTPVFDLETAKKTLSVMDAQAATARNAEAVAKKKKKVDEETKKIAEDELQLRKEIIGAVSETVAILEKAGVLSQEMASSLQGMIGFAGSIAEGDYIAAIVSGVGMFVEQIARFFDQTTAYQERIQAMNDLLEKQARLVEQSQRKGGEKEAREAELKTAQEKLRLLEQQSAEAQKLLDRAWSWASWNIDKRTKELKEITAATEEARIAAEEAEQAYTDFLAGGITENNLADTIIEGLRQGKIGVDDFALYLNDMLTEAVLSAFKSDILGPALTELQEMVAEALMFDGISQEEADAINKRAAEIAKENEAKYKQATQALGLGDQSDTTLQGAIKGITEETAGVLAGQVNAMRINQVEGTLIMRQQLAHLAEIASNTRYNKYLLSIDSRLAAMSADNLRAQGLNG